MKSTEDDPKKNGRRSKGVLILTIGAVVMIIGFYSYPFVKILGKPEKLPATYSATLTTVEPEPLSGSSSSRLIWAEGFSASQFNGEAFPLSSRSYPTARIRCGRSRQPNIDIPFYSVLFLPVWIILGGGLVLWPIIAIAMTVAIWEATVKKELRP